MVPYGPGAATAVAYSQPLNEIFGSTAAPVAVKIDNSLCLIYQFSQFNKYIVFNIKNKIFYLNLSISLLIQFKKLSSQAN
jgi:hypothetical protein